jgi:phage gp46-like protein
MIALKDNNTTGDFFIDNGKIRTDLTLHTIVYISIFGGNTQADTPNQRRPEGVENLDWWGNSFEVQTPENRFNSKFERALYEVALMSGNLKKYEQAAIQDCQWLVTKKIATVVNATASIVGAQRLRIDIDITKPDKVEERYSYIWDATLQYLQEA